MTYFALCTPTWSSAPRSIATLSLTLALSVLSTGQARAQEAAASGPPVVEVSQPTPARVAQTTAPAAPPVEEPAAAVIPVQPSLPAVGQTVLGAPRSGPLPGWAALEELQALRLQEADVWKNRESRSLAGPGLGIALGIAAAVIMVPVGGVLIADSRYSYYDSYNGYDSFNATDRRVGRALVSMGALALATAAVCAWQVVRIKRNRIRQERELYQISTKRGAYEVVLGELLRAQERAGR